jgi:hypothetical protein
MYLCTLLGLGFLSRFPRRPCGRSVRKIASIVGVVHVFVAYCASFWPVLHGISVAWASASFSCFFPQRLIPSCFGETRHRRFLLWSLRLFLVVSRRVRLMEGVVCDFLVRRGGPDFRVFGFPVQLFGFFCL